MPPKPDATDGQHDKKRRGRPPGPRRLAQEEVQALRAQHAAAQQAGSDAEDEADVPIDALLLSDPHEMARRYQSLLQASAWIHKPQIRLNGRDAELLGGHKSDLDALFVRCICRECLLKSTSGAVFSMEEFFTHSGLDARYDTSAVLVMQEGVQPVPLSKWLPAAAQHLGGHALVGQLVYMYWYGQPRTYNGRITSYGRWYVAIIREYLPATGEHRVNYKDGATWSAEDYLVYLPLAHVHFGSKCPAKKELPCSRPPHVMPLSMVKLGLPTSGGLGPSASKALHWPAPQPPPQPPPAQPTAGTSAERTHSVAVPPVPAPPAPRAEVPTDSGDDATQARATKRVRRAPAHLDDWPPQPKQSAQVQRSTQQMVPWSKQGGQNSRPEPAGAQPRGDADMAGSSGGGGEPVKKRRGRPPGPKRLAAEAEARARAAAEAAAVTKGRLVELDDSDDSQWEAALTGQQAAEQRQERQARLEAALARQHRALLRAKQHQQQQDGTDAEDEGGEDEGGPGFRGGTRSRGPDRDQGGAGGQGGRGSRGGRGGGSSRGRGRSGLQTNNRPARQSTNEGGMGERQHSLGLLRGALALADVSKGTHDVLMRVVSKCPQYGAGLPPFGGHDDGPATMGYAVLQQQQQAHTRQAHQMAVAALPSAFVESAALGPTSGASTSSGFQVPGSAGGAGAGMARPVAGSRHTTSTSVEMPAAKAGLHGVLNGQASPTSEKLPAHTLTALRQLHPASERADMPGQQAPTQKRRGGRQPGTGPRQQQVMAEAAAAVGGHPQDGAAGQAAAEAALAVYMQRYKVGSVSRGRGGRRGRGAGRGRGRGRISPLGTASDEEATDSDEDAIHRMQSGGHGVAAGHQRLLQPAYDVEGVQDQAEGDTLGAGRGRGGSRGRGRGRSRGRGGRGRSGAVSAGVGRDSLTGHQVHWADDTQLAGAQAQDTVGGHRPSITRYPGGSEAFEDGEQGQVEVEEDEEEVEEEYEQGHDRTSALPDPGAHSLQPGARRPHNLGPQPRPRPSGAPLLQGPSLAVSDNSAPYASNGVLLAANGSGNYRDWSGPSAPQPSEADVKQALAHLSSYLQSNRAQTTAAALALQQGSGHAASALEPSRSAAPAAAHTAGCALAPDAGRSEVEEQQLPDNPSAHAAALATLAAIYHENPYLQSLLNYQEYQRRSRRWNRRQHAQQQQEPEGNGAAPWAPRSRPPALSVDLSHDCRLLDPAATLGLATVRTSSTGGGLLLLPESGRALGTPQTTSLSALLLRGHSTVAGQATAAQAASGVADEACDAEGAPAARGAPGGAAGSSRGQQHGLIATTPSLLMACATASAGSPRAWQGLEGLHDELAGQHSWGDTLGILQSLDNGPDSSDTWSADDQGAGLGRHHVQRPAPSAHALAWPALGTDREAMAGGQQRQMVPAPGPTVRLNDSTTILMPVGSQAAGPAPPAAAIISSSSEGREAPELGTPSSSSHPRGPRPAGRIAEHLTAAPSLSQFLTQAPGGQGADALATALAAGAPSGPSAGADPALSLPIKPLDIDLRHSSSQLQLDEQPTVDLQPVDLQPHRRVAQVPAGDASAHTAPSSSLLLPACPGLDSHPRLIPSQTEHAGDHQEGEAAANLETDQQVAVPPLPGHTGRCASVAESPPVQPAVHQGQPHSQALLGLPQQAASQQGDAVELQQPQQQQVVQDEQEAHSPLRQEARQAAGLAAIKAPLCAPGHKELEADPVEHCIARVHLHSRDPWPSHSGHSRAAATLMADSLSSCARQFPVQCNVPSGI